MVAASALFGRFVPSQGHNHANAAKKRHHVGITNLTSFHFGGPWHHPIQALTWIKHVPFEEKTQ